MNIFINFGKLILFTLLGLGLVFAGYFAAQRFGSSNVQKITGTAAISTTPTMTQEDELQTIKGGSKTYTEYALEAGKDWKAKSTTEAGGITNRLILTKGSNTLTIVQTARGGQPCSFDDVPFPTGSNPEMGPVEPQKYSSSTMFAGESGETYRRVLTQKTASKVVYGVCAKTQDGVYFIPTAYGEFVYELPTADEAVLIEMDQIVSSVKKSE